MQGKVYREVLNDKMTKITNENVVEKQRVYI